MNKKKEKKSIGNEWGICLEVLADDHVGFRHANHIQRFYDE